jgi:peptide methionine sulfoxide reductase MsrA
MEHAVLAGGCFWGMKDLFRRYDGVLSTRVGYTAIKFAEQMKASGIKQCCLATTFTIAESIC